jgi:hypothetical protein
LEISQNRAHHQVDSISIDQWRYVISHVSIAGKFDSLQCVVGGRLCPSCGDVKWEIDSKLGGLWWPGSEESSKGVIP